MSLEASEKRGKNNPPRLALMLGMGAVVLVVVLLVVLVRLYEGDLPRAELATEVTRLGQEAELGVIAEDEQSGLRRVEVLLRQGPREIELLRREFPRRGWLSQAGPGEFSSEEIAIAPRELEIGDGRAELILRVVDYSWRNWLAGNRAEEVIPVVIDTRPPAISVSRATRYVRAGGSGLVRYTVDEEVERHGVRINGVFHPGFPVVADRRGEYVAYIGLPYDTTELEETLVIAEDQAGNRGRSGFRINLRKANWQHDKLTIPDSFLRSKLPEFGTHYPELAGSSLEQYLYVNRQVRQLNNQKIKEVCRDSHPERLWEGGFLRMARSSRRSDFADQRTYFYDGRQIDEQVHLGVDLASVRQAEIQAANHGIVAFADYLGIYGKTVIVDHGQGVFSLYAHLSQLASEVGQEVERGEKLGNSGATGMAGGDHLHFSMLINGVFVDPVEWWDRDWVDSQLTVER
ncbi:MAG: M23 family metallopeptidase [Desulfurivibrio sp.]|nr:M23 family metallopeptidase [Desulfurivibrio sp.]